MKALLPTGDADDSVAFGDVERPEPGPGEVLVEVAAFSPNRGETFLLEKPRPTWRPGKDVAGVVVAAAADGSGPAEGARVVAHPPASGWAEYVAVSTDAVAALPDQIPFETAAALPLAGLTALRVLRTAGALAGARVLVTGASGGVGHYLVELAAGAGADVTAVSATPERAARLVELGADAVVHDVADAEGPFDLALEGIGGEELQAALDRVAPRGTLVWFGQASRRPVTLDFFRFFSGPTSATIRRFDYTDSDVPDGDDLATLVRLVAAGRLHPEIGRTGSWTETSKVLRDLRDRGIRGNAVLTVD
ncbi:zinc-binding dehydrogenase [Actinomadura atramentaria]|uniref:zinc-binding dehydrogenase n=1 Tax=Actinomadura atramentaria TaxID=1990 RepID=UPI00036C90AF|nr:zinc-binding dehydrogenase [Actinomadura atramentaria]